MSDKRCPAASELASFVDAALPPEQLQRIEKHLELCSSCARQVIALTELVEDVSAPLPDAAPLDVGAHVSSVMARLDEPVAGAKTSRLWAFGGGVAMAAAALLLWLPRHDASTATAEGELTARGAAASDTLTRNVGVRLYALARDPVPLGPGDAITTQTRLTAGLRNLGQLPVHLLLFAIDSRNAVHWIAPEYESAGTDPAALSISPAPAERLLPSAAVFDDLAPGPVRVVAVLSRTPLHVSDVESLPGVELVPEALKRRFGSGDVREFALTAGPPGRTP